MVVRQWIVDASNVIGSRPDGWWRDRPAALARLVDDVARWRGDTGDAVLVVADGAPSPGSPVPGVTDGVEVRYADAGGRNAADDVIVATLADEHRPGPGRPDVVVVTSDRELVRRVRAAGAEVVGAGSFRRQLDGAV